MTAINFSHLVEIDESNRRVVIYRIFLDGRKQLFTEVELPSKTVEENGLEYESFFRSIGENILIDSPVARKIIGL